MSYDPREGKLPKWAQDLLADLRRKVEDAETRAEEARYATDPEGSDAVLYPHADVPVGLGDHAQVRFKLGPRKHDYADLRVERGALLVSGGQYLSIEPASGNLARVRTREDY
ncbi:hypothetical protein AB0H43_02905 [Hamadaea sp. NPDC050747]|uniref:DUF7239 family protein n=1 Tax=Hamadaea sp. NPDC050747 TaxID=3155789 RepID=UPI0033D4FBDB